MRILTYLHSYEPGGVERIALRLVRRWRALGIDAPLFIGRTDGELRGDVGRELEAIIPQDPPRWIARRETLWMIAQLPRVIRAERPDVLFCAGNTYLVVAVAMKLLLGRGCPLIAAKISNNLDRAGSSWFRRTTHRLWLRIVGLVVDHVVGMAAPMAGEIAERMGVPARRITIIPDPALSDALIEKIRRGGPRPILPDGGRRFLAVGRLAPQKNIALMLRAFARGAAATDRLTIIGEGGERQKLEQLTRRLGLGGCVEFLGYVAEPALLMRQYDVLLLSSDYEGVPAVVLEALAADIAVIATDCSRSMADLLVGGQLGELVRVGDERAFAGAVARVRTGRTDATLTLEQARRFTLERAAEAYLALFHAVALSRAPHASPRIGEAASPAGATIG
ncbi:glycosyltransferase [Sphingomonas sp.]|uniref:glycosyltransferase n=1 Tax=Sphingomonas sp. TaxID=28214 RepID=UPI000DB3802D|nr:glycosyltransferase [Sphingomonas sp.]PZU09745.1 MAG: glycosyltransferase [Sphingomonas sp.]